MAINYGKGKNDLDYDLLKTQSISEISMYKIEDRSRQNLSHFSCVLMCTGLKCPVRTCNSATML